jgi:DNA-binding response OmpR family regulator
MAQSKKRILVVEDERDLASLLKRKLDDGGFITSIASDGEEGLKLALDEHPDLILLDIVLPVMDGLTMLEKLRKDRWGKAVPVIVLSNLSTAESIAKSRKRGVNHYLVKTDWKLNEVLQKVKRELGIKQ